MDPFEEGRTAAASGGANPYTPDTDEHDEWEIGFQFAGVRATAAVIRLADERAL